MALLFQCPKCETQWVLDEQPILPIMPTKWIAKEKCPECGKKGVIPKGQYVSPQ